MEWFALLHLCNALVEWFALLHLCNALVEWFALLCLCNALVEWFALLHLCNALVEWFALLCLCNALVEYDFGVNAEWHTWGVHKFFGIPEATSNSKHQKGNMNQAPYWGPTNLRHHCTKSTYHSHSIVVLTISLYVLCMSLLCQVWCSKLHSHFKKWIYYTIELLLKSWLNFTPYDLDILISRLF